MNESKRPKAPDLENGVDFIGNMPGPILQLILQGLPNTEEVVRTSILSKQWRSLWTSIPLFPSLNIDCDRLNSMTHPRAKELQDFVSTALANKTLDLDSFCLSCSSFFHVSTVWQWVNAAVTRRVKRLDLMFCRRDEIIRLPHCLVACESLESLRLYLYGADYKFPDCNGSSALKVLELNNVGPCGDNFSEKLSEMCPLLEKLSLIDCHGNTYPVVSLPKLKTLIFHDNDIYSNSLNPVSSCPELVYFEGVGLPVTDSLHFLKTCPLLEELRLINCKFKDLILRISCPKLKTLIIHDRKTHIRSIGLVVSCPELVFFECVGLPVKDPFIFKQVDSLKTAVILPQCNFYNQDLWKILARTSHVESLSFDCSIIRYTCDPQSNFPQSLPSLKTLELTTTFEAYDMELLSRMLTCSPNLESIHLIIKEVCYESEYRESDHVQTMRILSPYLKRVEFLGFERDKWKLEIAQLLLEHGSRLEKMVFSWFNQVDYHEKSMVTLNEVSKFHKASSSIQLVTLLKTDGDFEGY